jgi:hypothetical protein
MRNKLYIVGVEAAGEGIIPIEYFLSRKQAQIYIGMIHELENTMGAIESPYCITTEHLNTTAQEAMERLRILSESDDDEENDMSEYA